MYMKRFAVLAAVIALIAGCRQNAAPVVEGRVTDATINYIILETPDGESVSMSIRGTNPMMVPGVLPGDEVRVAYELLPDDGTLQALGLDILGPSPYRLLPGIWRDCSTPDEVGLVLAEDGSARSVGLEELALQDWSLDGDQLVLTASEPAGEILAFQIGRLDADSLIVTPLSGDIRRLAFARQ